MERLPTFISIVFIGWGGYKTKTLWDEYLKEPGVCHLGDLDDGLPGAARRHRRPDRDGLLRRALRLRAELT